MMKRLLIDMDSVLVNLLDDWLALYNQKYNDSLKPQDILAWDMERFVKPECGTEIYTLLDQPHFFRNLPPIAEGPQTIHTLLTLGYEIFLVTAPPTTNPTVVWEKLEWVREHMPFFAEKNVIFSHQKYLIQGDLLFDDCPEHLNRFPAVSVAMDYNYNKNVGDHRVNHWKDFLALVTSLHPVQKRKENLS